MHNGNPSPRGVPLGTKINRSVELPTMAIYQRGRLFAAKQLRWGANSYKCNIYLVGVPGEPALLGTETKTTANVDFTAVTHLLIG